MLLLRRPGGRVLVTAISAACLAAGSALYVCLRHDTLLMFRWMQAVGALSGVSSARVATRWLAPLLPDWVIFSLPYALWVASYMLAVEVIWYRSRSRSKYVWLAVAPAIALFSEIAQAARLIPGTFDWDDLALLVVVPTIVVVLAWISRGWTSKKTENS